MTAKRTPVKLRNRAINSASDTEEINSESENEQVKAPVKKKIVKKKSTPKKQVAQPKAQSASGKTVRDSFTMPDYDYELIDEIKIACMKQGVLMNKAEILRAGLRTLILMSDTQLKKVASGIEKIKTGRPKG